ncbi:MAG: 16S rRNA (adenine(1518)-N(6)/adenine(1519)-N(6))-dimethyltransferase RsmA [Ignavibacteriaceae bacterium]
MDIVKPLKRFGQNYLKDTNILKKIVDEVNPKRGDNILEIGPGRGALTKELLKRIDQITAVEIDKRVIEDLTEKFPQLKIVEGDFLSLDLNEFTDENKKKLRIAGNIPYNLTSPILFKLIEKNELVNDAILMVQYEVAKRMTAQKGTKDYGILAMLINYFTETKICFKVSPNVFYPKPKVFSAVVHIIFKKPDFTKEEQKFFIKIVKAAFGKRRKTLKNSLSNSIFKEFDFSDSGIDLSLRAEQLDVKDFVTLTNFVVNQSG